MTELICCPYGDPLEVCTAYIVGRMGRGGGGAGTRLR